MHNHICNILICFLEIMQFITCRYCQHHTSQVIKKQEVKNKIKKKNLLSFFFTVCHHHTVSLLVSERKRMGVMVNLLFIQNHQQKLIDSYKLIECVCSAISSFISLIQFSSVTVPYGTVPLLLGTVIHCKKNPCNNRKLIV